VARPAWGFGTMRARSGLAGANTPWARGNLLLRGLYACYSEHERCGKLDEGVEDEGVFNLLAFHLD
jgi:hypothetical protein